MDTNSQQSPQPGSVEELTRRNVGRVLDLEAAEHEKASRADRVADAITAFSGSVKFVWFTVGSIGTWVVFNLSEPGPDPFPFPLLTLVLSVEAIFLAIFILMSQNRAARVSEKRSNLDLQLNLLSEQENTKMLLLLKQIGNAVGIEIDTDVDVLAQPTQPEALSEQIDQAAKAGASGGSGGKAERG